jgi:hypothetical protein
VASPEALEVEEMGYGDQRGGSVLGVWSTSSIASWSDDEEWTELMRHRRDLDDDGISDLPRNKMREGVREMRTGEGRRRVKELMAHARGFDGRGTKMATVTVMLRRAISASRQCLWRGCVREKERRRSGI